MTVAHAFKTFEAAALAHDELLSLGVDYLSIELTETGGEALPFNGNSPTLVTVVDTGPVAASRVVEIFEKYGIAER